MTARTRLQEAVREFLVPLISINLAILLYIFGADEVMTTVIPLVFGATGSAILYVLFGFKDASFIESGTLLWIYSFLILSAIAGMCYIYFPINVIQEIFKKKDLPLPTTKSYA